MSRKIFISIKRNLLKLFSGICPLESNPLKQSSGKKTSHCAVRFKSKEGIPLKWFSKFIIMALVLSLIALAIAPIFAAPSGAGVS